MAEDGPSDELNPWLLYLYRHALVTGLPPSATVAATLGKSTATIRRWLAPLRESGELPEPEGPGRAGG